MITIMVIFCIFLVLAFIVAVLIGLIALSPGLLIIILLVALDVFMFKMIFSKKKKK